MAIVIPYGFYGNEFLKVDKGVWINVEYFSENVDKDVMLRLTSLEARLLGEALIKISYVTEVDE